MKLKIEWKELMRQIWAAVHPVLLGAIGGNQVAADLIPDTYTVCQVTHPMRHT